MNRAKSLGLLFSLILGVSGCSNARYYVTPDDNIYTLADYSDAVDSWTERSEIHHNLIGVAKLTAVYRSWEVRQAYINTARNADPGSERVRRIEERELNRFYAGHEFTLGLYCHEEEWNQVSGADPVWQLSLCSDSSGPVKPILVEKDSLALEEAWFFYDELSHWGKIYRVVFPLWDARGNPVIGKSTRYVRLFCSSLLGTMELKWKIKPFPESDTP